MGPGFDVPVVLRGKTSRSKALQGFECRFTNCLSTELVKNPHVVTPRLRTALPTEVDGFLLTEGPVPSVAMGNLPVRRVV